METEASEQQLLDNGNSFNLTQEPLPTDGRTARDLLERVVVRRNSFGQGDDNAAEAESPENALNRENDDSPTVQYRGDQIESKSPDDVCEDDGKMLQEEGGEQNLADQEEPKGEAEIKTAEVPARKYHNEEEIRGLIAVKPTPHKPKNANDKVGKLRSLRTFRRQDTNMNMKKETRDHYVNVSDLLPEGIESADALRKFYEDKRSMKKIRHLSSFPKAHEDEVYYLIFSPDGKYIVSGSNDRTIKIWDVNTKRQLYHIKDAHENGVRKLAITSDSKYLISGSLDNTVKIWDFATRQLVHHFENAHQGRVSGIAVTSDNKYMATCSWDLSIKIFDLAARKEIAHIEDVHTDVIRSIKITSDNKYIITASDDGTVKLFDFETRKNIFTFESLHSAEILTMALSRDNRFIVTGSVDKSIKIVDLETRKEIHCFNEDVEDQVDNVAISHDEQYVFAGISNGSMLMFDLKAKKKVKHFKDVHTDRFYGLAISKNMDFAISCSSDKSIEVTEIQEKKKMFSYLKKAHSNQISGIAWTKDSKYFMTSSYDRSIKMFDAETKSEVHTWHQTYQVVALCITPDNKYVVCAFNNTTVNLFNLETKEMEHSFPVLISYVQSIAVSADSKYVVACADRFLILYNIEEKTEVYKIENAHDEQINDVVITPDTQYIVTGSTDKSIRIFDLDSKELVYKWVEAHNDDIYAISVTPNNKFIVSGSRDFSIKIFDLETKQLVHSFVHAHDSNWDEGISSDSRFVVSCSADESVRVFDLTCREMVCYFQNTHNNWSRGACFSPNNKLLVSAGDDGSIKIYDFETVLEEHHFESVFSGGDTGVGAVAVSPNNQMMAAGSQSGVVSIFNMNTKELYHSFEDAHSEKVKSMTFTPDNKFLVTASADASIGIFDIKEKAKLDGVGSAHRDVIYAIAVTPDGKYIISGSKDRSIKVIEFATRETYHHFKEIHEETIRSIAVTPDSKWIISASTDKSIKVIDIEKKQLVYHFRGAHPRWIKAVSVSSDGKYIATCSDDRSIKLFDLKTKQLVHWFKNAHDNFIESVVISDDCRYIVSGSRDNSVRIFDIQTRQQIQNFRNVHRDRIRSIALSSDNQYIVSSSFDGSIKILKMSPVPLPSPEATLSQSFITSNGIELGASEIYYVYNGFTKYSNFNAVDDFLFNPSIPIKTINASLERCQGLTVLPFAWNILHIAAIRAQHNFIKNMPEYAQFKVPFLLDAAGKTPLHYLIAHHKLNSNSINVMLTYICDYVDGLPKHQHFQAQEILISLTPLFWLILAKTEIKIRERFLNICFIAPPMPYNYDLPIFGKSVAHIGYFHSSLESIYSSINKIWTKGDDQIDFRTNIVNLDYHVLSDDMTKTIKVLRRQAHEEVFKTDIVTKLIDHLWNQSRFTLMARFVAFSTFMIALSVYLSLEDDYKAFDIIILIGSGLFMFSEFLQVVNLKFEYLMDPWNWLDTIHFGLTMTFAINRLVNEYQDNLTLAWIATAIILTGYLRWISYLKIFKPTRNLIQVIVTILSDMKSFIIIIAMIVIGFSFVFLFFNKGSLWGFYLMDSYGSMYGPIDGDDPNFSQKLIICFISFLLNVVLLNLLISIMGDSYERVLEKRVKTDSLTRLEMIAEATTHMKYWRCFMSKKGGDKGYLVFCLAPEGADDDEENDDWEGKIQFLSKQIRRCETSTEKRIMTMENEINRKLERVRKDQLDLHEKTDEMLELLKNMNGNGNQNNALPPPVQQKSS